MTILIKQMEVLSIIVNIALANKKDRDYRVNYLIGFMSLIADIIIVQILTLTDLVHFNNSILYNNI